MKILNKILKLIILVVASIGVSFAIVSLSKNITYEEMYKLTGCILVLISFGTAMVSFNNIEELKKSNDTVFFDYAFVFAEITVTIVIMALGWCCFMI